MGMISVMTLPAPTRSDVARESFETAVHEHSRRLYGVALSITRDSHEAEDAVQETMVKAWKKWHNLRDPDRRAAWLTRICVNHCISGKRKRSLLLLTRAASLSDTDVAAPVRDMADPDLSKAYERLTRHQRAVLTLHYHYGFSLDESAVLMKSRPGTVRSHLARALATLRVELQEGHKDGR
jgi:RNA polymerase sigma-70 factor (ECF subfamily)